MPKATQLQLVHPAQVCNEKREAGDESHSHWKPKGLEVSDIIQKGMMDAEVTQEGVTFKNKDTKDQLSTEDRTQEMH